MYKQPMHYQDPTKFEHEYEYCCGTTCDKFKVKSQFKQLEDELLDRKQYIKNLEVHVSQAHQFIMGMGYHLPDFSKAIVVSNKAHFERQIEEIREVIGGLNTYRNNRIIARGDTIEAIKKIALVLAQS